MHRMPALPGSNRSRRVAARGVDSPARSGDGFAAAQRLQASRFLKKSKGILCILCIDVNYPCAGITRGGDAPLLPIARRQEIKTHAQKGSPRERGRPARTNAWHSLGHLPPLGSTGNGAMALLRPGRCGYCRRSGCLQSRAEAQRPPKGQHAGGTPALPGAITPPLEGESQKPSRQAKADAAGGSRVGAGESIFFYEHRCTG